MTKDSARRMERVRDAGQGFTLAELLIVVAIIGVLVAISIPLFAAQLEKARVAADLANARSAKSAAVAQYLAEGQPDGFEGAYDAASGSFYKTDDIPAAGIDGYGKSQNPSATEEIDCYGTPYGGVVCVYIESGTVYMGWADSSEVKSAGTGSFSAAAAADYELSDTSENEIKVGRLGAASSRSRNSRQQTSSTMRALVQRAQKTSSTKRTKLTVTEDAVFSSDDRTSTTLDTALSDLGEDITEIDLSGAGGEVNTGAAILNRSSTPMEVSPQVTTMILPQDMTEPLTLKGHWTGTDTTEGKITYNSTNRTTTIDPSLAGETIRKQ